MNALLFVAALLLAAPASAETVRFALIGDTPYKSAERHLLPAMLEAIGASGAALVIHIGDFKSGGERCSDEVFAARHRLFDDAPLPFVYVPGDNDWTDCHRANNGAYDPLERLGRLRQLFFADPVSLGQRPFVVERQSAEMPEQVRWRFGPVRFVTLNVPGSDNNWGTKSTPSAEYRQRMPQVLAWLRDGFRLAKSEGARVIVLAMQADPDFRMFAAGAPNGSYRELLETLRAESQAFAGEVLLVHGDTHHQQVDHPLRDASHGAPLANFTRIETHGSPFMGWTEVEVDSRRSVPLRIAPHSFGSGPRILP